MIAGARRSFLMSAALAFGLPNAAKAMSSASPSGYTCPPCGCVLHGRLFSSPGLCPICGMVLIPAAAILNETIADFPPAQLEMRVPFAPTAIPSAGREHLIYELHLRNLGSRPLPLSELEIRDPRLNTTIAIFKGATLEALIAPIGQGALSVGDGLMLGGGRSSVVFIRLVSAHAAPLKLQHRMRSGDAFTTAAGIDVAPKETLRRLEPPVRGSDWVPTNNAGEDAHHRVGLLAVDGAACIARRYAIDWKRQRNGAWFDGDAADVGAYHAYGQTVVAVADARVVVARDGLPDNRPRTDDSFALALPLTLESIGGNLVILDLGGGLFASYAHLQPRSVKVQVGQRVRRGQALAAIGNSGDSRWPHLHFQVSDGPSLLGSEGVPYVIDAYAEADGDQSKQRRNEMPMRNSRIDFR